TCAVERLRERAAPPLSCLRVRTVDRREMNEVAVETVNGATPGVEQPNSATTDRIEHRLHVGGRPRNHTKDLCSCRLPLQRVLRLVEQPHVLDGDDRLVGEGLE